ncbi:MAG: Ig-like domain-containing protein [Eubacteriales bacterium]|nr:Ig-like domain-containing protein [Eubacteriales bacterium]
MKRTLALLLMLMALFAPLLPVNAEAQPPASRQMLVGEEYTPISEDKGGWQSSAPTVATASDQGVVTALTPGEAIITQTVKNKPVVRASILVVESAETPEQITRALDIALGEWQASLGKTIGRSNKYTKWYCGRPCEFGWCGGFVSYCLDEAGLPMAYWRESELQLHGNPHAVREADVLKLLRGYTNMGRISNLPRPGYLVVYGKRGGYKTIHVGLVTRAEHQGEGVYLIETVEGNVSKRIKRYSYLYDSLAKNPERNMKTLPETEWTDTGTFQYQLITDNWHVNAFCQTWY